MISAQTATAQILQDSDYPKLKLYIISTTGLSYFEKKDEDLAGRIALRFADIGQMTCAAYLNLLGVSNAAGSEYDHLILGLTIGETYFFRHIEQFEALKNVIIPELIKRNFFKKSLTVWCAGCSTGAEPYSVSILLKQHFKTQLEGWSIQIHGTDINRNFLRRARAGSFNAWHLRTLDDAIKSQCFIGAENTWDIKREFKKGVSFHFHNLITSAYPPIPNGPEDYDVIICRNVMIYFAQESIEKIVPQFNECLAPSGWLLLGYSEINIDLYKLFDLVSCPGAMFFQKKALDPSAEEETILPELQRRPVPTFTRKPPLVLSPRGTSVPPRSSLPDGELGPKDAFEVPRSLADAGDLKGALKSIDALLGGAQLNASAHLIRGILLSQMANSTQAEAALRKAIYLDRSFVFAHYHLGLHYLGLKEIDKALQYFDNVKLLLAEVSPAEVLREGDGMTAGNLINVLKLIGSGE